MVKTYLVAPYCTWIAAFFAPIIGGLVAQIYSFKLTVALGVSLLVFSLIPIMTVKDKRLVLPPKQSGDYLGLKAYWKTLKKIGSRKLVAEAISLQLLKVGLYWPLFVGLAIFASSPYSSLGILSGVGALFAAGFTFIIGRFIDKGYEQKVIGFGVLTEIALGIGRFFVSTPIGAVTHDLLWKNGHAHRMVFDKWYLSIAPSRNEKLGFMNAIMCFRHVVSFLFSSVLLILIIFAPLETELQMIKYFCIGITPLAVLVWFLRPNKRSSAK